MELEKKKIQEKINKELLTFEKDEMEKMEKILKNENSSLERERMFFSKDFNERKELYERQRTNKQKFEGDLNEEIKREESKLRKNNEKYLDDYKRDQEYEVQKAMVSARNRKSQLTLQEKIRELREEYKVKEEVEAAVAESFACSSANFSIMLHINLCVSFCCRSNIC